MALVRIWRTNVDPLRVTEYERFAQDVSLPMFRAQQGFLGVLFAGAGPPRAVLSFWKDQHAVDALASSPSYGETVARILATGMLAGETTTEILELHGGQRPEVL